MCGFLRCLLNRQPVALLFAACLCVDAAWGTDPAQKLAEYQHLTWLVGSDGLNGDPYSVAQSGEGYLWVGTSAGLFRFDGERFKSWREAPSDPRLVDMILSLYRAHDGSIWAAAEGLLYHISDNKAEHYNPPKKMTFLLGITEGAPGTILYGGKDLQSGLWQLCTLHIGGSTNCEAIADDGRASWIGQHAILYADNTTWVGVDTGVIRFRGAERVTIPFPALASNVNHFGVSALQPDGHGGVFVGVLGRGPGLGLQHIVDDKGLPLEVPGLDTSNLQVSAMVEDANGALWIGTADKGIYRIVGTRTDHFDVPQGLPGQYVTDLREDHEGSMWVTTRNGVTRFADGVIVSVPNDQDFHSDEVDGVQVSANGTLWVTGRETLQSLRPGASRFIAPAAIPASQHTSAVLQDHNDIVWFGLENDLYRLGADGKFARANSLAGSSLGQISSLAEDSDFNIWVIAEGPPQRTLTISPDRHQVTLIANLPAVSRVVADHEGGVFLAALSGDIIHIDRKGIRTRYQPQTAAPVTVHQLSMQPNGMLLASTTAGLYILADGVGRMLDLRNGMPCEEHENALFDNDANLWIYMQCGLVKINKGDFSAWEHDPSAFIPTTLFDAEDGALPARSLWNGAGITPDGTLWFAAGNRLQRVAPGSPRAVISPPIVKIEDFIADRQNFVIDQPIRLPPLTRDVQINYAGLSFVSPDKMQFRYRLDNYDRDWKEAGSRRQALYTGLPPGQYRFHVTSRRSGGGSWNPQEQSIEFELRYALYQTPWFKILCGAAISLALFMLVQFRVKNVASKVRLRQAAQHAERERIARELHDTFLQSVQGLIIKYASITKKMPIESPLRKTMEELLNRSDDVVEEARSSIQNLREREKNTLQLPEKVALLAEQLSDEGGIAVNVSIQGKPYELVVEIYENIYAIAQEAIRNAGKHSFAKNVEIEVNYGTDIFRLAIRDDGRGMDDHILTQGRHRHWGLVGMRERAKLINGRLKIVSRLSGGTEVELSVLRRYLAAGDMRRSAPLAER